MLYPPTVFYHLFVYCAQMNIDSISLFHILYNHLWGIFTHSYLAWFHTFFYIKKFRETCSSAQTSAKYVSNSLPAGSVTNSFHLIRSKKVLLSAGSTFGGINIQLFYSVFSSCSSFIYANLVPMVSASCLLCVIVIRVFPAL